jgi:4-hydroxyphenylpyruvate dioxygenase
VEFYCGDARSLANHFAISLGMSVTGTTSQATGNDRCVSYALESGGENGGESFRLLLTAPYSRARASSPDEGDDSSNNDNQNNDDDEYDAPRSMPNFSVEGAHAFFQKHGLAARAVGVEVADARVAFEESVARGAVPVLEPSFLPTCPAQLRASSSSKKNKNNSGCYIAEVELYGDVVLRYVSFSSKNNPDNEGTEGRDSDSSTNSSTNSSTTTQPFLPHLAPVETSTLRESYGIYRIDHAVGNVHDLQEAYSRILGFTGFHEFAEFTSEDVGTVDSGLNSVVLASDTEQVLLPINEPTNGR